MTADYTTVNAFSGAYDNDEWSVNKKDYIAKVLHTYLMQWLQIQIIQ